MTTSTYLYYSKHLRPELVSGSIHPHSSGLAARWMLKQVQHDVVCGGLVFAYWRQAQARCQIGPMRVFAVDEIYLPRAVPVFKLLFSRNCAGHIGKQLKADKAVDGVFGGETIRHFAAMLLHTLHQIRRYADVKRAINAAGEHIYAGLFFFSHRSSDALKWTLKQVQGDGLLKNKRYRHNQCHLQNQRHPEFISGSIGRLAQFKRREQSPQDLFSGNWL